MTAVITSPVSQDSTPKPATSRKRLWWRLLFWGILLVLLINTPFIVKDGHIGIINRIDQSLYQAGPGIHLKIPLLEPVSVFETRTRLTGQDIQALSQEKLSVKLHVSANWHIKAAHALGFYQAFQTPEQFETRVLLPQLKAITGKVIAKQDAATLLDKQDAVIHDIYALLNKTILTDSLQIDSLQIENVTLPEQYRKSMEALLTEQNLSKTEHLKAEREKARIKAQLETTEAEKSIKQNEADTEAYVILTKGEAEAKAIRMQAEALQQNRTVVDYLRVQKWDGKLAPVAEGTKIGKLPGE